MAMSGPEVEPFDLWDAYAATHMEFADATGQRWCISPSPKETPVTGLLSLPWPLERANNVWVITAWNPESLELGLAANRERNLALEAELRDAGYVFVPALGRGASGDWAEESYLVLEADREWIVGAAIRWEQNAVFHWTPNQWSVVGALTPGHREMSWVLDRVVG